MYNNHIIGCIGQADSQSSWLRCLNNVPNHKYEDSISEYLYPVLASLCSYGNLLDKQSQVRIIIIAHYIFIVVDVHVCSINWCAVLKGVWSSSVAYCVCVHCQLQHWRCNQQ